MQETNLKGAGLYRYATMLEIGQKADFKYTTIKDAINAAAGAGNCRMKEGTSKSIVIKRWTSVTGEFYVTVAKVGKYDMAIINAPALSDFENDMVTDAVNRSMIKGMLQEGFTTMDILEGIENWSEEKAISEIEKIKKELALEETPEM
jgi:hypothetical protein